MKGESISSVSFAQRLAATGRLRMLGTQNQSPLRIGCALRRAPFEPEQDHQGMDGRSIWTGERKAFGEWMTTWPHQRNEVVEQTGPIGERSGV